MNMVVYYYWNIAFHGVGASGRYNTLLAYYTWTHFAALVSMDIWILAFDWTS